MAEVRRVEPVEYIKMIDWLRSKGRWGDLLLIAIGYETGFRPSDIAQIRRHHLLGLRAGDTLELREQKKASMSKYNAGIKQTRKVIITPDLAEIIRDVTNKTGSGLHTTFTGLPVFTKASLSSRGGTPVTPTTVSNRIASVAKECGLPHFTAYSLRKGYAYRAYLYYKSLGHAHEHALSVVGTMLNHGSIAMTARYLGFTGTEIRDFSMISARSLI